jgi:hypothetical protein
MWGIKTEDSMWTDPRLRPLAMKVPMIVERPETHVPK